MQRSQLGQPWFRGVQGSAWPTCWQGWLTHAACLAWVGLCILVASAGLLTRQAYDFALMAGSIVYVATIIAKTEY